MGSRIRASTILIGLILADVGCKVETPPPQLLRVQSPQVPGGRAFTLQIQGRHLKSVARVQVGPHGLAVAQSTPTSVTVEVPALTRGRYAIRLDDTDADPLYLSVLNSPPRLEVLGPQLVPLAETMDIALSAMDFDGDPIRIEVPTILPGLQFDLLSGHLRFRPRLGQAGQSFAVIVVAHDGFVETRRTLNIEVPGVAPPLGLEHVAPQVGPGGASFEMHLSGYGFTPSSMVLLGRRALRSRTLSRNQIVVQMPALPRGDYGISIVTARQRTSAQPITVTNAPPTLKTPLLAKVKEEAQGQWSINAVDMDEDALRIHIRDLPPGATFDQQSHKLTFRPDFIQGGRSYVLRAVATDGVDTSTQTFSIEVDDSIAPPWPTVLNEDARGDHTRVQLGQVTDDFLDSPNLAGRSFDARVSVPTAASAHNRFPVRVFLHGYGGKPYTGGEGDQFRIYPHDSENTYWWGYSARAPLGLAPGPVHPYTARRVLHLVEWVLTHYPGADPDRVYINGTSMGGAGAAALGLIWARHFTMVDSMIGQTIARNHRPSRIRQLSEFYGAPDANLVSVGDLSAWDKLDLVRVLAHSAEARQQFVFSRHAKDDPIIHFGAAVQPSRDLGIGWLAALQAFKVGHYAVWDEGAHGPPDPVMGKNWWDDGWDRILDPESWLNRNTAFIAFSHSEADQAPGDGGGNGRQPWDEERGFAGELSQPQDTGWSGAPAGALNRYLRWNTSTHIDTWKYFSMAVQFRKSAGAAAPREGYPAQKGQFDGALPVHADLTPRRVQAFLCYPGEVVAWHFGQRQGQVTADKHGALTVPHLPVTEDWTVLELRRVDQRE